MNYDNYEQQPQSQSLSDTISQLAALPTGIGLGAYAAKNVWHGSPAVRSAVALGAPYALYQYLKYRDSKNLADALAGENKKLYDEFAANPNSATVPPEQIEAAKQDIYRNVAGRYMQPARSAMYDAVPMFAVGAALPMALAHLSRRQA